MKILKYLFFLLLIVFIAGAIYFATKDGNYDVEESTVIEAPIEVVFNKINDYRTWEDWGPWKKDDPTMVFNYPENTIGKGASYSWNGEDVDGSMRTIEVVPNSSIKQDITFKTPAGERKAEVFWQFEEVDNGTRVTWALKGEHTLTDKAYFTISGYDFNADMHKMYKTGLEGLAASVKRDMEVYNINVDGITQYSGGFYMYTTASTTQKGISAKVTELLSKVTSFMQENRITMAGKPMTIYNNWDENNG
ncbi:MAG: SRPBCC family protein, partial [Leeuwenhoekiella sp.]